MTLDEVVKRKRELESKVLALLKRFEKSTGARVRRVNLEEAWTKEDRHGAVIGVTVELGL